MSSSRSTWGRASATASGSSSIPPREPGARRDERPSWGAGIVNHGSYDDLEVCLAAIARQDLRPAAIAVYDTGEDPARLARLREAHPEVGFESGANRGYAGGANRVVGRLESSGVRIEYILLLNPDVELDPDFVARLIDAMVARPCVAIATGKLLRPDRRTLDSAGIFFGRHGRPRDRGSEEPDRGRYDRTEAVDAASGAAMMLRVAAIEDLRIESELFDEDFFAYHEDTDLCWRARRFGWSILYEPAAVALHRRGWQRTRRSAIPIPIRRHSFKNHYLQIVKNETASGLIRSLPWLVLWEILRLGFVLLRDRPMAGAYLEAARALPAAWRKRRLVQQRARRVRTPSDQPGSASDSLRGST